MPSSAMYARGREPTAEGDKLGFIKLMVAGRNRAWHARLIQDMFKWEGVIANDFEDEFLQDPQTQMDAGPSIIHAADAKDASHSADGSGSNRSGGEQDDVWRESRQERYQGVAEVIVEHYASSMVLPAWARAGLDVQEMQQEILVKNICFVDTPGYSSFNNPNRAMDLVVSYLGLQFQTTNEFFARSAVSDDSLGRFLANNATGAHSHVDACLYIIEGQLTDLDVVFMQRLQAWVNLIPVLIPSTAPKDGCDTTMTSLAIDVSAARQDLIRQLQQHDTEIYGMEHVIAAANATDSPFSSDASPEDDLSPPPLSLDGGLMHSDVTSPPFVYMVPLTNLVAGAAGGLDQDVQQLDVTPQDESSYRPASASVSTSQPSLPSSSDVYGRLARADLALLQKWIFVDHLAALRHHTTLKFLRWRRYLPTVSPSSMNSSMDLSSSRYRQPSYNQNSYLPFPHLNGTIPGTLRPFVPTTAGDSPPLSATGPTEVRQYPLPTELASELMARDQKRVSCKAARLLGTHRKVFERIMLERQEAWRRALQGIEREHRIDFLVRELKRWATSDQSIPFEQQVYDTDTRPLERSMEGSDHVVGLGSEVGMAVGSAPSLRDALSLSSSVSLEPTESGRRGSGGRCVLRPSRRKSGRVAHSVPLRPTSTGANEPIDDEVDSEDPLGLGLWMSEIFGAIGNGIVHVVALVGMGSLATWIYTHYLEHQVTWIG
ncbi:hypothetical protein EDD11_004137 [Mortierella claussenii]|nr:hypothetical protein EDD11_004137 [Mortierella claussenii]